MTAPPPAVLHVSTADLEGGSARSAWRIHEGLRRRGHVSRMLVGRRTSTDADVDTVHAGRFGRLADRAADRLGEASGLQYLHLPSSRRVLRHPWLAAADVVQLYNTHGGYFSQWLVPELSRRAALVWRLSDAWAMTGHCAYPGPCERWRTGCGQCPDLEAYPRIGRDTTAWLWRYKDRLYRRTSMDIVAPSSWTERMARESPLLHRFPVHRIPNGIDTGLFRPRPKAPLRDLLGLDPDAVYVLFSAHVLDDNPRKGGGVLMRALERLGPRPGVRLLLVGMGGDTWRRRVALPVDTVGYLRDGRLLAAAYAAADLAVVPSELENLPNTVLEAMGSGLPVIASDAGGTADAVRHETTGLLFASGDDAGLARHLDRLLGDAALRARLGTAARALIEAEYAEAVEVGRFAALYAELAARRGAGREAA